VPAAAAATATASAAAAAINLLSLLIQQKHTPDCSIANDLNIMWAWGMQHHAGVGN